VFIRELRLAVVDFCVSPKLCAESFSDFRVIDPNDVINTYSISVDSSLPDHRILTVGLKLNDNITQTQ